MTSLEGIGWYWMVYQNRKRKRDTRHLLALVNEPERKRKPERKSGGGSNLPTSGYEMIE